MGGQGIRGFRERLGLGSRVSGFGACSLGFRGLGLLKILEPMQTTGGLKRVYIEENVDICRDLGSFPLPVTVLKGALLRGFL